MAQYTAMVTGVEQKKTEVIVTIAPSRRVCIQTLVWSYIRTIPSLIAALLCGQIVIAEDNFEYEIRLGAQHTDNVSRSDANEIDETILTPGAKLSGSKETRRFRGTLDSDFEYQHYLDGTFGDENTSSVNAEAEFDLVEDVLSWVATDSFGVLLSDPFTPEAPDNRENINVFTTGPNLDLNLGARTVLRIGGRFRNAWFEESESDYDELAGSLALIRTLSRNRSLSLNFDAGRTEFDNTELNSNFDRNSVYLDFSSRMSRGAFNLEVGYNALHDFGEVSSGLLAGLSISRNVSASSSFTLSYSRRFSDAGDFFDRFNLAGAGGRETIETGATGDPFEAESIEIGYDFSRRQTNAYVALSWNGDTFEQESFRDNNRYGGVIGVSRKLAKGWQVDLDARYDEAEFDVEDNDYDEYTIEVNLQKRVSRLVIIRGGYTRIRRDSETANQSFNENRYSLYLVLAPG